jgi:hypothetical protein
MAARKFFTVIVCLTFAIPAGLNAMPRPSVQIEGAGFRIGLIVPEHFNPGFTAGGLLDFSLWKWLHFSPSLEYSYAAHESTREFLDIPYYSTQHSLHEFSLNADLRFYPFLRGMAIRPYGGGGLILVASNEVIHFVQDYPFSEKDEWSTDPGLGFDFLLGTDIPVGAILCTVETKAKVGTGRTLFKFTAGLTFPLFSSGRK